MSSSPLHCRHDQPAHGGGPGGGHSTGQRSGHPEAARPRPRHRGGAGGCVGGALGGWGGRWGPPSPLMSPCCPTRQPSAFEERAIAKVDDLLESYMGIRDTELGEGGAPTGGWGLTPWGGAVGLHVTAQRGLGGFGGSGAAPVWGEVGGGAWGGGLLSAGGVPRVSPLRRSWGGGVLNHPCVLQSPLWWDGGGLLGVPHGVP